MKTISIPMQKSPESFVRQYLSNKIGFNIRLGETKRNRDGTWTISLKAVIPSFVKLKDGTSKTFVYTFEDVGIATVKYEDYDFDFIIKPKAPELDLALIKKIDELTTNVQKEILDYGKFKWGKLSSVRWWFGSIHGILLRCLNENSFNIDTVPERYMRYFEFLQSVGWVKVEHGRKNRVVAAPKLIKLHESLLNQDEVQKDANAVADVLIGHIYASHFTEIRDELKFYPSTIYLTTTKGYYADAVRDGRSISMDVDTLWLKYRTYNYSPKASTHRLYRFPDAVGELVSNDFLRYTSDKENVIAVPELLDRLLPFQDELRQNVVDI